MKIPKRKISATVLEFGEPFLGLLEEPTVEEFRAALNIVIVAWNVLGVSMGTGDDDNRYLDELARFRRQIADEGAPAEMLAGFDALNARRVAEHGDDPRCVGEWDLVPDDLGGYTFRCDARLLGGGTVH